MKGLKPWHIGVLRLVAPRLAALLLAALTGVLVDAALLERELGDALLALLR